MDRSLSNFDISKALKNRCNIFTYDVIFSFNKLDELFGKYKFCIILYLTSNNYGHWCCLLKRDKNKVEFFDSYGIFPDKEFLIIEKKFRIKNNMDYPYLVKLLYESNYKIEYNDHRLQGRGSTTCGRWVIARCLNYKINIDDFAKEFLNKNINPDKLVIKYTSSLVKKY